MTMHELAKELAGKAATKIGLTVTLVGKDGSTASAFIKSVAGVRLIVKIAEPVGWLQSGPVTTYDLAAVNFE